MTNENHIFRMIIELNNDFKNALNLLELSESDASNFTCFTQNDRLLILSDNPVKLVNLFTKIKSKHNEIKLIHLDTLFKEIPSQISVKEYIKESNYEDYCITKRKNKASFKCLPLNLSGNVIDYKNLSPFLNTNQTFYFDEFFQIDRDQSLDIKKYLIDNFKLKLGEVNIFIYKMCLLVIDDNILSNLSEECIKNSLSNAFINFISNGPILGGEIINSCFILSYFTKHQVKSQYNYDIMYSIFSKSLEFSFLSAFPRICIPLIKLNNQEISSLELSKMILNEFEENNYLFKE